MICLTQEDAAPSLRRSSEAFHLKRICLFSFILSVPSPSSSSSSLLLASRPGRCVGSRPGAEGCLCPFSLITSHLCVHKQTNTSIRLTDCTNGGARGRRRGGGGDRRRQSSVSFTVIHEAGRVHLPCSVTASSLEGH